MTQDTAEVALTEDADSELTDTSVEVEEYLEMEDMFQEHGRETTPEVICGTATVADFQVFEAFDTADSGVTVHLYFTLPTGEFGKIRTNYSEENPAESVEYFLEENHNPRRLAAIMGSEVSVHKREDKNKWKVAELNKNIQDIAELPDWDASERNKMNEQFAEVCNRTQSEKSVTSGKAEIVDYYVQKSAGNITQNLEIGFQFVLPDGRIEMYECIHDDDHPDEGLEKLLSYFNNPDNLYEIINEKVPVVYDTNSDSWQMHLPKQRDKLYLLYGLERLSLKFKASQRLVTIEKTYSHANDRGDHKSEKRQELEEKMRAVQVLEQMDIAV